jgi:phage gpG-like protein
MRQVFNDAAKHVVGRAQPRVPVRTGRLAASIQPASTQRTGRVAYTRPGSVPYAGFIEFGGRVGRGDSISRPYLRRGRYLFPAAEREREPIMRTLEQSLGDLIRRAGLG